MCKTKILISDAESRKSFDLIHIYSKKYDYQVIPCSSKNNNLLSLVYGQKIFRLRLNDYVVFCSDLDTISKFFQYEDIVYIPASELVTLYMFRYITDGKGKNIKYMLPEEHVFQLCRNKYDFQHFCNAQKFPVPKSFSLDEAKEGGFMLLPLVVKPRIGAGSVGLKYLKEQNDLKYLNSVEENEVLIQQKITSDGTVAGAFFLCRNGEVINAFSHKRIRTFPDDGGVTVFSESTYNKSIIEAGTTVLRELNWNGLAMIEFMFDTKEKQWKIIELNPRIWGSVMLAAFNESGMLYNYVQLATSKPIKKTESIPGRMIRWFYPYEIINFLKRKISFRELMTINRKQTCYINSTYAGSWAVLAFHLYMTFNIRSINRFFQKTIFRK